MLICPPWGPDEIASYRPRRAWAERLAVAGHPTLRFDLPGTGNSTGGPHDERLVESWLDAIAATAGWLRRESGSPVTALGLGLGGLLATEAVATGAEVDGLALWGVPKSGHAFLREMKAFSRLQRWKSHDAGEDGRDAEQLAAGGFEVDGLVISAATAAELEELQGDEPARTAGRALLISRETGQSAPPLVDRLAKAGAEVEFDAGGRWGGFVSLPTKARLPDEIAATVDRWLDECSPRGATANATKVDDGCATVEFEIDGRPVVEEAVSIDSPDGELFGVVVKPADCPRGDLCGVFLNAGALRTIGPNRLWVDQARAWAARGVPSLRLDFARIGEAGGDPDGIPPGSDYFLPEFQSQLVAALDKLSTLGLGPRIFIVGNCSGAYHGLRTAVVDARVSALVMINPSVIIWRPGFFEDQEMRANAALLSEGKRLRKLLRGEIGIKRILEYAKTMLRAGRQAAGGLARRRGRSPADWRQQLTEELEALHRRGADVTFAFSAEEPTGLELERGGFQERLEGLGIVRFETLPGNDHTLRSLPAQEGLDDLLDARLEELSAAPAGAATMVHGR